MTQQLHKILNTWTGLMLSVHHTLLIIAFYKHFRERIGKRLVFSINELENIICLPTDFKRPQAACTL